MAISLIFNPIFDLWLIIITGFALWQLWNLVNSFRTGLIYDLGKKPLYGYDKEGKWHPIMQISEKDSQAHFMLARLLAIILLILTGIVWIITLGVFLL